MLARIFSTLVIWIIAVVAIIYGKSYGFTAMIMALSLAVNYEICTLLRKSDYKPILWYVQVVTILIFACSINNPILPKQMNFCIGDLVFTTALVPLFIMIVKDPYGDYVKHTIAPTVATIFISPFMLKFYALVASSDSSAYSNTMFAVWIISAAKFSDIGAYVIGCAFGRHKMAPTMSPNKTWEGAIGGILSSAVIGATLAWICGKYGIFFKEITPLVAAIISIPIGMVAIVSDLLESVFKRRMGVKDSGAIIPGIGGAFDLADSLILCAPLAYLVFLILVVKASI